MDISGTSAHMTGLMQVVVCAEAVEGSKIKLSISNTPPPPCTRNRSALDGDFLVMLALTVVQVLRALPGLMVTLLSRGPRSLLSLISRVVFLVALTFSCTLAACLPPKSTALYRSQAPFCWRVVFQPSNGLAVSCKAMLAPDGLRALYRSGSMVFQALLMPTPRRLGVTLRMVPSSLKKRLSIRVDRFLSKFGE